MTQDIFNDCLLLADDFYQYYLGAYSRSTAPTPRASPARATGRGLRDLRRAGDRETTRSTSRACSSTSHVLPPAEFPQFASQAAGRYVGAAGGAFDPVEGSWYVGGVHVDNSYMRLARTIDLTGVTAGQTPQLQAKLSFDTEPGYDNVIVEAHHGRPDTWTTLPEAGGLSRRRPRRSARPGSCSVSTRSWSTT